MSLLQKNKTILIVAAHPDDEILGCGATVAKLTKDGCVVYTLILGQGKTSREYIDESKLTEDIKTLSNEIERANKLIGVREVFIRNFPDNAFDKVPLLDIVKEIEIIKNKLRPDIIFTHHFGDLNIDHQITQRAVLTATRPMDTECVKEIYSFEIPSSTEWNSFERENIFVPNVFVDISGTIEKKIKAMSEYKSELRAYPHPRSLEHIKRLAQVSGVKVGLSYSENFTLLRMVGCI
jgi:LmbE family N-acetylglucosaminyl deacetylase